MNDKPKLVSAIGHKHFISKPITTAYLTVKYNSNFIAHINVNWLSPVKIRQTIVAGSKKMIVYNDLEPSDKLSVYDKGVDVIANNKSNSNNLVNYKIGDTFMPYLKNNEALSLAVDEFLKSIHSGLSPLTDGASGLNVVKILEAANKSINKNGKPITL
jgi:predicted dehydrogenase